MIVALALGVACGGAGGGVGSIDWEAFVAAEEGRAWSWRGLEDDGEDTGGALTLDAAIRGRGTGGGAIELRTGDPWVDATPLGELVWDTSAGITLARWSVGDAGGDAPRTFAEGNTTLGDVVASGGQSCTLDIPTETVETRYGGFDDVVVFDCSGDDALAGVWTFARNHGLVRVDASALAWELIAPM